MVANRVVGAVFLAILVVTCQGTPVKPRISDEHNIDDCDVTKATKPLLETNTFEDGQFLTIKEKVINYPESSISTDKITCIKVTNMDTKNQGGYPRIVSGGVGSYDVQILLKSQIGQALNFRIEIYAEQ